MRHRENVDREGLERRRTGTKQGVDSDNVNDFVFSLGTVHCTGNLSNICSQIQEVVDEQQKKAVWVPLSSVWIEYRLSSFFYARCKIFGGG